MDEQEKLEGEATPPPADPLRGLAILRTENPRAAVDLTLTLIRGRSAAVVYQALATKYPTEESLMTLLNSQSYLELIDEVATVFQDIRATVEDLGDLADPEAVQDAVDEHYPRALDAVGELAELLGVPPLDLISLLLTA